MDNALIYQVQSLLSYNKIPFDREELAFQIKSHPSYPSLHAITGVLEHFAIDNLALDIPTTQEVLNQLPKTFLAQVETGSGKEFAVIINKGHKIEVIKEKKNSETLSPNQFLEKFTGIIVAVERTENVTEIKTKSSLSRKLILALLTITVASLIFLSNPSTTIVVYLILAILGSFVSIAIIKQQLGLQTDIGNTFCSSSDTTKDCNAVLSSKGALIFNTFKLSDISIVYFTGLTLSVMASIIIGHDFFHLLVMSLLATPVIIYSIYYQYAFAKAWCPLCLIVAGVLGIQGVIAGLYISEMITSSIDIRALLTSLGLFTMIIGFWSFLSPKMESLKKLKQIKIDYFKFKRNFDLFKTVLDKSPIINTTIPLTTEIIFGNKNAPLSIVIVTSPFCGHCKPVHTLVEEILKTKENQVAITVRFNVNTKEKESDLYKVTSRLTEIYLLDGPEECMKAMHDIYDGLAVQKWLTDWGTCKDSMLYDDILNAQNNWCQFNNINFTPEILINGRSFPKEYDRKDLAFFIEDLSENCLAQCLETNLQTY